MSFQVRLYTHSKRDNSTKRPSGDGTIYNCVLKHGCGILNPSISLDLGLSNDPSNYNYAYIPAFGRYYFIEEWFFEDRLWTASLNVDVLATYKTQIGNANLYVLRASNENNGAITDVLYPARTGCNFATTSKTNPWTGSIFVVGIVTKTANFGSLGYYVMTSSELSTVCSQLMDMDNIITTANGFDLSDASKGLQLSLVDPIQYIKTCVMLPVGTGDFTGLGASEAVYVYNWRVGAFNKILPHTRIRKSYNFEIQKHPDTSSRGNYVNSAPFTVLNLTMPPYGCIEIDSSVTCTASNLDVDVEIDPITGTGILVISCNGTILNRLQTQIGVPISLSSVVRDYVGAATGATSGIASLAGLFDSPGSALVGAITGIGNAVKSYMPRAQTIGSTGSFVSNRGDFRLDHQFFRPIADDNAHNGRPLCAVRNIANLGGYMIIQDGDVAINGTATEDAKIKTYLESGFYYE